MTGGGVLSEQLADSSADGSVIESAANVASEPETTNGDKDWIAGQAHNDRGGEDTTVQPPRQAPPATPPQEGNSADSLAGDSVKTLDSSDDSYSTVSFYLDEAGTKLFADRIVQNGDNVPEISIPSLPLGMNSFWGWYTADQIANSPINPDDAYKFDEPITADTAYYAVFSDKFLVQFLDGSSEIIIHAEAVEPNTAIGSAPSLPILSPSAGKAFTGDWHLVSGGVSQDPVYDFASSVTGNLLLTPDFASLWTVSFSTKDRYQPSQTIFDQDRAVMPPDPDRRGYHFEYWSENPNATAATIGDDKFDFDTEKITKDSTLYAIYTGGSVNYKVVYWVEKENKPLDFDKDDPSNYQFAYMENKTGVAGVETSVSEAQVPTSTAFKNAILTWLPSYNRGAPYSAFYKSTTEKLRGDNSTIINVYYTRTIYTLQVNLGTYGKNANSKLEINIQPNRAYPLGVQKTLTGTDTFLYQFQAKLGMSSEDVSPTTYTVDGVQQLKATENGTETHRQASFGSVNAAWMLSTVPYAFEGNYYGSYTGTTFTTTPNWSYQRIVHFVSYFEALDQDSTGVSSPGVQKDVVSDDNAPRLRIETLKFNNGTDMNIPEGSQYFELGNVSPPFAVLTGTSVYHAFIRENGIMAYGNPNGAQMPTYQFEKGTSGDDLFYQFGGSTGGGAAGAHYYSFYRRLSFKLGFETGATHNSIPNSELVKYEASVAGLEPCNVEDQEKAKTVLGLADNEEFQGWFTDSNFLTPFDFKTETMPAKTETPENGVVQILYAKIVTVDHNVSFKKAQSEPVLETVGVADGGMVDDPGFYEVGEIDPIFGEFLGWFTIVDSNTVRYDFDRPVYADTEVFGIWVLPTLSVKYDTNGGTGSVPVDLNSYGLNASARIAANADFTKNGLVFAGWERYIGDTDIRFDSIVYYPGMTFSVKGDTEFRARYIDPSDAVKLIYYRNTSETDTKKRDMTQKKNEKVTPSVATALSFARAGYTFLGWSSDKYGTEPDTGFDVASFADFRIKEKTELHAVWKPIDYTVKYLPGTHGTFSPKTVSGLNYSGNTPPNTPAEPKVTGEVGWKFEGWDKAIASKVTENATYTAQWSRISYTITYHGNGHSSGDVPKALTVNHGEAWTVSPIGSLVKDGYSFLGWSTKADGSVSHKVDQQVANITGNVNLYAVWQVEEPEIVVNPLVSYTVTYDGNGSTSGNINPVANILAGSSHSILQNAFARTGYTFLGWSRNAGATAATYTGGENLTITGDVTLYAIWQANVVAPTIVNPPTDTNVTEESEPVVPESPSFAGFSPVDQQRLEAQTGNILSDLANGNVPLGGFGAKGAWSLLSGIMSIVAVVISIILVIGAFTKRRRGDEADEIAYRYEESEKRRRQGKLLKVLTCLAGVFTLIVWIILDDFSQPMVWINKWTLFVGIVFIVHLFLLVVYKLRSARKASEYEEEYVA
ncbi:MAG: InlB B-repeat-containing protein [Clostridiales Family XIII bacterium]|jgi:uncharacterized repeat protein (TIGR02543 family)|nr:InlB B-repeat-containing protein [Clostridiales Family XIII bacterium]